MTCPDCGIELDVLMGGRYDGWTPDRFMREGDPMDGMKCGHCDCVLRPLG